MSKVSLIIFSVLFLLISVSFASLDGDVNTDLICVQAGTGHGAVDWFEYDRISSSVQWRRIADSYTEEFYSVISGDFDGDTRADLLVGGDDVVYWYESYQDNQVTLVDSFYVGGKVNSLAFDTLSSGRVYVAAGTDAADPNDWIGELGQLDADSNDSAVYTSLTSSTKQQYLSVTPSDFDQDGLVELLVGLRSYSAANPDYGHTALFEVQADGSVAFIKLAVAGWMGGDDNVVADIDGDGYDELFISGGSTSYGVTSWYQWDGSDNGFFYIGKVLSGRSGRLHIGDVDGDSTLDLLFASYYASGWLESTGVDNGLKWNGNVFGAKSGHVLVVGDWDGDGIKEVIYGGDDSDGKLVGLHLYKITGDDVAPWQGALAGSSYYLKDGVMIEPPAFCGDLGTSYINSDLNRDCIVNMEDFSILASDWISQ
ncbi:MAG: FG-GAP repeat domain-containing protein [Sedimentisphaeraceae bacterium JB056]